VIDCHLGLPARRCSKMTDGDLDAMVAWVRTIPPLE
jgi:hypothetical protein